MNVIFTCGGTGGHINPAIAIANALKERCPDANIIFIGKKGGMEENLVPKAGYELKTITVAGLMRDLSPKGIVKNVKGVFSTLSGLGQVRRIIKDFKPQVVVGTGGYVCFPALFIASKMGVATCVHEANALPGLATRMLASSVDKIMVCFAESAKHYKQTQKVKAVGMPVREEFFGGDREKARAELGLDNRPLIVSAFGSLGAEQMNKDMARFMKLEQDAGCPWQHIHATGSRGWSWMPGKVAEEGVNLENCPGIEMREYIYNMPTLLAAADLFISRAGAGSCNELAAAGVPSILIPSPNVTDNHQEKNARVLVDRGACAMVLESECSGEKLYEQASELLSDPGRRARMRRALQEWVVPDSARQIVDTIIKLSQK